MEINILTSNIGRFLFIVLLQVLILSKIEFTPLLLTPYIYPLFILLLPFEISNSVVLIFSLAAGLSVDIFYDTGGAHASSLIFMGFARKFMLRVISPRDGYEIGIYPRIYYMGFTWFAKYTLIMVFIHHSIYFLIEIFSFAQYFDSILRIIFTTILSSFLIILSQFIVFRK